MRSGFFVRGLIVFCLAFAIGSFTAKLGLKVKCDPPAAVSPKQISEPVMVVEQDCVPIDETLEFKELESPEKKDPAKREKHVPLKDSERGKFEDARLKLLIHREKCVQKENFQ